MIFWLIDMGAWLCVKGAQQGSFFVDAVLSPLIMAPHPSGAWARDAPGRAYRHAQPIA